MALTSPNSPSTCIPISLTQCRVTVQCYDPNSSITAAVFKDLINTEINNNSRIVVIATSKSHDSLHPSLLTSQGCHVFQCRAEIHPPDADQRQQILSAMMARLFRHRDRDILELR